MKLTYDPRYNVAYIQLQKKTGKVQTLRITDDFLIDISSDGNVYGIELLNANKQLGQDNKGQIIVTNDAVGDIQRISLALAATKSTKHKEAT